jgi:hypothetical protein
MSREGIKVLFKLPLRQTTGMVASLLKLANLDWAVPDYTTLCRRQKTLAVQVPYRPAHGPLNLLVDSTGIKFLGDGALSWFACKPLPGNKWQARKHGVQGRRQWRKVHLAMDTATSDIRAVEFTPSSDGDSPVLPDLLDQIPEDEEIGTVTAPSRGLQANHCRAMDGAYDARRCHTAIHCLAVHVYMHEKDRPTSHRDHPGPQKRATLERGLSGCLGTQRNPAGHTALWPGVLEALDRIPCPKSHRGQDALPEGLWRTHLSKRPRPPNRRNPNPYRTDEPLLGPRHGRDRSRELKPSGKGEVTPQA